MESRKKEVEVAMQVVQKLCEEYAIRLEPFILDNGQAVQSIYDTKTEKRYFLITAK